MLNVILIKSSLSICPTLKSFSFVVDVKMFFYEKFGFVLF